MTGPETLRAASSALERFARLVEQNEREVPGVGEMARHLASPDSTGSGPDRVWQRYPYFQQDSRHPLAAEAVKRTMDNAVYHVWSRSRVAYAPHPGFLGELAGSTSSPIPLQVLGGIPHPDPFVLLPAPVLSEQEAADWGEIGVPVGAFTFGRRPLPPSPGASPFGRRREGGILCSSLDERRHDLGLVFVNLHQQPDGSPMLTTIRVNLPLRGRALMVEEMVQAVIGRFRFNQDLPESERAHLQTWLHRYVGQVVSTLLYCCTDAPDMTEVSRKPSGKRGARRLRPGEVRLLEGIGYRLGPALVQARRQAERDRAASTGQGGHLVPHWRSPHMQTYWTGPGRTVPRLHWIDLLLVNKDLLDGQPPPVTVHPVRRRGPGREAPGPEPQGLPAARLPPVRPASRARQTAAPGQRPGVAGPRGRSPAGNSPRNCGLVPRRLCTRFPPSHGGAARPRGPRSSGSGRR